MAPGDAAPGPRRHRLGRMIEGDGLVAEAAQGFGPKDLVGVAVDAHLRKVRPGDLVAAIDLDVASPRRAGLHYQGTVAERARARDLGRGAEAESVEDVHGGCLVVGGGEASLPIGLVGSQAGSRASLLSPRAGRGQRHRSGDAARRQPRVRGCFRGSLRRRAPSPRFGFAFACCRPDKGSAALSPPAGRGEKPRLSRGCDRVGPLGSGLETRLSPPAGRRPRRCRGRGRRRKASPRRRGRGRPSAPRPRGRASRRSRP